MMELLHLCVGTHMKSGSAQKPKVGNYSATLIGERRSEFL
jgi:hypothetical protein